MEFYRQLTKTEKRLIVTCLLCLLVSSFFLYNDDWLDRSNSSNRPEVGVITMRLNDTRLKTSEDLAWFKANEMDKIRIGDAVFSGENSQANIRLLKGGEVIVNENSMVLFSEIEDEKLANLVGGTFRLKVNGKVKVAVNGKITTVEGHNSEVQIEIHKGKRSTLQLIKGDVKIKPEGAKTIALGPASATPVELGETTPPPPPQVPSGLVHQQALTYIWHFYDLYENKQFEIFARPSPPDLVDLRVELGWSKTEAPQPPATVELGHTPDFVDARRMQTSNPSLALETAHLGENFWRVSYDGVNWSQQESFVVQSQFLSGAEPHAVVATHEVPLERAQTQVHMRLKTRIEPRGFVVQASTNPGFTATESHSFWSDSAEFNLSFYRPGYYYYRFRTVSPTQEISAWSTPEVFHVFTAAPPAIPLAAHHPRPRRQQPIAPAKIAAQKPEHDRKPADLPASTVMNVERTQSTEFNDSYKSSLLAVEGLLWTMQSTQQYYQDTQAPVATGLAIRALHWWNHSGVEGDLKVGVLGLNPAGKDNSLKDFEGRYYFRFDTPFPFGLSRELQIAFFAGFEAYRNTSELFSDEYNLLKFGTSLEFPLASRWSTGGEVSYGYGFDASTLEEISGHLLYYLNKDWSLGGGYRVHLFQAGSTSSAPEGILPYREGYTEGFSVLNYHY